MVGLRTSRAVHGRRWLVLALTMALTGCASGVRYADSSTSLPALDPAQTRLTIFREWHFSGGGVNARVKIDGKKVGTVPNGSVLVVEHASGNLKISLDSPMDMFDGMDFNLKTEPGETYYIEIRSTHADYMQTMGGALPYLLGSLRAEGVTDFCGHGWCAALRTESVAVPKLADLDIETPEK